MAKVATLATSTTRPKRRYTRVTPALHARLVKLKARGLTHAEIAHRVGICEATVSRVLSKPLTRAEISDFATRLGVDRQQLRETVKVSLPLIRPIRSRRPPQYS
jgi:DNA-binding NarL/FixJ family response regulator